MDKGLLPVLLILGVCTSSISGYPLLFQQGGLLANNGINFLPGYQNLLLQQQQQEQLLRMTIANSIQPLYYTAPNLAQQNTVRILKQLGGVTGTVGDITGTNGGTGDGGGDTQVPVDPTSPELPVEDQPVTTPVTSPGVSPCAIAGITGNAALSSLCCSLIGALSPCSLLGLGGLGGIGGLAGLGGVGGATPLPSALTSLLLANSIPGLSNLGGLGGCPSLCSGLTLPQLPISSCCGGTNVVVLPIVPVPFPGSTSPTTPVTGGGGVIPPVDPLPLP